MKACEDTPIMEALLSSLEDVRKERDRYRKALVAIADSESGVWGKWASAALREKDE